MNEASFPFFALVTLAFLIFSSGLRLWLAWRQRSFVITHRGAVPAAFMNRVTLDAHQKAADYALAKLRFGVLELVTEILLFFALTWGGGLTWLHEFWIARQDGIVYAIALIASVLAISALVGLPLAFFRQFRLESRFGFNRMTPTLFFSDFVKQICIAAILGLPLLAAMFWLMMFMGAYWWFYVWLLWAVFNLLILFVYPFWIAPFFNRFTPLSEGEVKKRVQALLERGGFDSREFFVMDGSRRSSHGNAYFTGFGKARRIVLFDTLLEKLAPTQVEAVLAHELGHFHYRHILKRIVVVFGLAFLFFMGVDQLLTTQWFFAGLGIDAQNTPMALTLFALVLPWFSFPFMPLFSAWSRRHEFEADAYAARTACADDLIAALIQLYKDNAATLTPDPLYSLFYDSHPSAGERVAHLETLAASAEQSAAG